MICLRNCWVSVKQQSLTKNSNKYQINRSSYLITCTQSQPNTYFFFTVSVVWLHIWSKFTVMKYINCIKCLRLNDSSCFWQSNLKNGLSWFPCGYVSGRICATYKKRWAIKLVSDFVQIEFRSVVFCLI